MRTLIAFLLLCSPAAAIDYNVGEVRDYNVGSDSQPPDYYVPPLTAGSRVLVCVGQTPEAEAHYREWAAENGWAFFRREPGDGKTSACPRGWQPGVHENEVASGGRLVKLKPPSRPSNATVAATYFQPEETVIVYGTPTVTCHEAARTSYQSLPSYQPIYEQPTYRGGDRVIASDPEFSSAPGPEYVVSGSGASHSSWDAPRQQVPAARQRSFSAGPARTYRPQASGFSQSFSGGFGAASCGPSG